MLLQTSKTFTYYLLKKNIIEQSKTELFIYGFQLLLSTSASIITILILSCFFNIVYGLIFLLYFMPMRLYAGGYHASTYRKCYIYTNACFISTMFFSKLILEYGLLDKYIIFAIAGILYLGFSAPCKNPNNPLTHNEIIKNKSIARLLLFLYCLLLITLYPIYPFLFLIGFNTLFLVSIFFIIGNLKNKLIYQKGDLL